MNRKLIIRVLGAILAIEALAMLPSFFVSLYYRDGDTKALIWSIAITLVTGSALYLLPKTDKGAYLRLKEGFIIVAIGWIMMSCFGAMPFIFSGMFTRFEDAFFEGISLVEWPEKMKRLFPYKKALVIDISCKGNTRYFNFHSENPSWIERLQNWNI